jgi:hypothetical protein
MLAFPGSGDDISVSRSFTGFCMSRAVYSQITPLEYSRYCIINKPLKGIENTVKGLAISILTILSFVEALTRLSVGLSALPLSFVLMLPCFDEKLYSATLSFVIDRIADFAGNLTMICRAKLYKTHHI